MYIAKLQHLLTINAMINPMLKLISTCINIFNMYSAMDSSRPIDLNPMNLQIIKRCGLYG